MWCYLKKADLRVFGFFMIGYPGETSADIKMSIDFACRNAFDAVVFTCFQPIVGTPVYEKLLVSGEIVEPPEGTDFLQVSYAPVGLSIAQLKVWRFWALFRFYTSSFQRFKIGLSNWSLGRILTFIRKTTLGSTRPPARRKSLA